MKRWIILITFIACSPFAAAHDLFIYPTEGQDRDQQDLDEAQCSRFAQDQTGFNPRSRPVASTPAPQQQGGAVGGAARGALLGTAVGAIGGNTRRGAAIGAASGGLMGGMRRADSNNQQEQWAQQESANLNRQRDAWNRAFSACLEARGYTVR